MSLEITGRIEALALRPGDRILVTLDADTDMDAVDGERFREEVAKAIPGHDVLVICGATIDVLREETE